jgi:hypothetical protein
MRRPVGWSRLSALLVLVLFPAACAEPGSAVGSGVPDTGISDGPRIVSGVEVAPTTTTIPEVVAASGGRAGGYATVTEALDAARERWEESAPEAYGYLLATECECDEAGSVWVRIFPDEHGETAVAVTELFNRIGLATEQQPETIEVEFAATDGHPVSYRVVDGDGETSVRVEHFHSIVFEPTEFDGTWRFASGTLDGEPFKNPTSMGNFLTLDGGSATYTVSCNTAYAAVDIYAGWIGIGPAVITAVGCGESLRENEFYVEGLQRAERIRFDGSTIVLDGTDTELHFARAEVPEYLGELPLTAAGETLTFEIPDGRQRYEQYIVTWSPNDLGGSASYLLTATTAGSDDAPSWRHWEGEPETPATVVAGAGPDTIAIPGDISNGDFGLCSPYWEPNRFCFTLRVRPPSAPWIVTAGPDGVLLHDANGTSESVFAAAADQAFYLDGRLVIQPAAGSGRLVVIGRSGDESGLALNAGDTLIDAALVGGRPLVLVTGAAETALIDLVSGERRVVGSTALGGRIIGSLLLLRTGPELVSAIDTSGTPVWERTVTSETMVAPDGEGHIRFDRFHTLQEDAGSEPYLQYIATELVDPASGETVAMFEREIAIPDEGDAIAEPCIRTEIENNFRLCPQPDGRIVTLDQYDGTRTLTLGATATFARIAS